MINKKIKSAVSKYIDKEVERDECETKEIKTDLSRLDERVYASLEAEKEKRNARHSSFVLGNFRQVASLAAAFVLVICLTVIITVHLTKPVEIAASQNSYNIIIKYNGIEYGYLSNQYIFDKYGSFAADGEKDGTISEENIMNIQQPLKNEDITGLPVIRLTENILFIGEGSNSYYFERIN